VGEPLALRERLVGEVTRDLLLPMLLVLPMTAAAVWWGVGRGLLPLARVTTEVAERSPSNLQPVGATMAPVEISGLVERLNQLLARVREALDRERRFTADAAHELRTPLAGIRTHAQVALRTTDDAQRRGSLEQVIDGVDRTTRLVAQMLTLARLDREAIEDQFVTVNLGTLATQVVADLYPDAEARHTMLTLQAEDGAATQGHPTALGILLRNVIDNAIRYTPPGGAVEVKARPLDGRIVFEVTDNGPGIPPAERARVFDRFYRGTGADAFGCGLGLSIARRVADLHGARIALAEAPSGQGLQVTVWMAPTGSPAG
jgi:two-component system sensor histidine kinase QseC